MLAHAVGGGGAAAAQPAASSSGPPQGAAAAARAAAGASATAVAAAAAVDADDDSDAEMERALKAVDADINRRRRHNKQHAVDPKQQPQQQPGDGKQQPQPQQPPQQQSAAELAAAALTATDDDATFHALRASYKQPSRILSYLYVGTKAGAMDRGLTRGVLAKAGITHILNVAGVSHGEMRPRYFDDRRKPATGLFGAPSSEATATADDDDSDGDHGVAADADLELANAPDAPDSSSCSDSDADTNGAPKTTKKNATAIAAAPPPPLSADTRRIRFLSVPLSDFGDTQLVAERALEKCFAFIAEAKLQHDLWVQQHPGQPLPPITATSLAPAAAPAAAAGAGAGAGASAAGAGGALRVPRPGVVLLHCSMGVNRSPTVAIAWLIAREHMTLLQAYAHVQRCRPRIAPHELYMDQLRAFEVAELGLKATTMPPEKSPVTLQQQLRQLRADHIAAAEAATAEGGAGAAGAGRGAVAKSLHHSGSSITANSAAGMAAMAALMPVSLSSSRPAGGRRVEEPVDDAHDALIGSGSLLVPAAGAGAAAAAAAAPAAGATKS